MITKSEFLAKARAAALEFHTVYMKGVFGAPLSEGLLREKAAQYPEFYTESRLAAYRKTLREQTAPVFGFDCVCLVKGILWGWCGDAGKPYGGAVYASGGMGDYTVEQTKSICRGVSGDFSTLTAGELLFMPGHVGIYLGDGLCVEATTKWQGGVLLSGVSNVGFTGAYPARRWNSHGALPFFADASPENGGSSEKGGTAENDSAGVNPAGGRTVTVTLPYLQKRCKGEAVRAMQALLLLRGQDVGKCGVDGSYGGDTVKAVTAFQKANGLTADGICGVKTWPALLLGQAA